MNESSGKKKKDIFLRMKKQALQVCVREQRLKKIKKRGGVKMAEEQDGVITFSSTNSLKEQQNGEQSLQNNF